MSRILLVEDDTMIASGILYALETEGYETNHATGIKDARSLIQHYNFDLAIIVAAIIIAQAIGGAGESIRSSLWQLMDALR